MGKTTTSISNFFGPGGGGEEWYLDGGGGCGIYGEMNERILERKFEIYNIKNA